MFYVGLLKETKGIFSLFFPILKKPLLILPLGDGSPSKEGEILPHVIAGPGAEAYFLLICLFHAHQAVFCSFASRGPGSGTLPISQTEGAPQRPAGAAGTAPQPPKAGRAGRKQMGGGSRRDGHSLP